MHEQQAGLFLRQRQGRWRPSQDGWATTSVDSATHGGDAEAELCRGSGDMLEGVAAAAGYHQVDRARRGVAHDDRRETDQGLRSRAGEGDR